MGGQRTPWSYLFQGAETQPLSSAPLPCRLIPRGQREARPSTPIEQMKAEAGGGEVGTRTPEPHTPLLHTPAASVAGGAKAERPLPGRPPPPPCLPICKWSQHHPTCRAASEPSPPGTTPVSPPASTSSSPLPPTGQEPVFSATFREIKWLLPGEQLSQSQSQTPVPEPDPGVRGSAITLCHQTVTEVRAQGSDKPPSVSEGDDALAPVTHT